MITKPKQKAKKKPNKKNYITITLIVRYFCLNHLMFSYNDKLTKIIQSLQIILDIFINNLIPEDEPLITLNYENHLIKKKGVGDMNIILNAIQYFILVLIYVIN